MKKKTVSIMVAATMALSLFAGCGSSKDTATEDTSKTESTETTDESSENASAETTDESSRTTFTVGFDAEYPPYGYMDDDGEYTGFDLELAQAVCDLKGWELVKTPINWDSKDMELNSGSIDCIWNGFTITGREDDYTWTTPYMANKQVFVVANDSDIKSQADLAGKVVEVQADSSAEAALKENQDLANTFGQLLTTPDYNTAFMDLEQGAVDAVAMDVIVAGYQIKQRNADFKILDDSLSEEEYGIGFKKGNEELRDKVQSTLEEMADDGTLAKISDEWFGEDVTTIGK